MRFTDMLYGVLELPEWIEPFLRMPEFVRLRGVRLSNVDSVQFKDFNGPTRWEHCIAVAALAFKCGTVRGLSEVRRAELVLAGLLHDVATPPFAHTFEYVLDDFDHEAESQRVLEGRSGDGSSISVFRGQVPQFRRLCRWLATEYKIRVDPDEVARMVVGQGELGFLISGSIDLDNIDNVTRASLHLGITVDRSTPLVLAEWLARQERPPVELESIHDEAVQRWLSYRRDMYICFFTSSEEEIGRQAFLQHLLRRGLRAGLSRGSVIWQTDELLLDLISRVDERNSTYGDRTSLEELVSRYRLLEPANLVLQIPIYDAESLRVLRVPKAGSWIEDKLTTLHFEPFVVVTSRRHGVDSKQRYLFPPPVGTISVFKLGPTLSSSHLPDWLRNKLPGTIRTLPKGIRGKELTRSMEEIVGRQLKSWLVEKPWLEFTLQRNNAVVSSLEAVGNWSFHLSRNEALHPYPSTFVHAIPSTLIRCLGLSGELIVDVFGGTGQTALEAVKGGCGAVSIDSSSVATMIARAQLSYISKPSRERIASLNEEDFEGLDASEPPALDNSEKWFHPQTLKKLLCIKTFCDLEPDHTVKNFLYAAFSATLPQCTARKGKEHAYFADNTPLPRSLKEPPFQDAAKLFIARVKRNVSIIERTYGQLERDGRDVEIELGRVKAVRADARSVCPAHLGIEERSVAGIVTSPPYLCTIDYTLGQRLSYAWLFPDRLKAETEMEIGRRRDRFLPKKAVERYFDGLNMFAEGCARLLRPSGVTAVVLGVPAARSFVDIDVVGKFDEIMLRNGHKMIWSQWRPIHWQRNYGLGQMKRERISVYVLR